MVTLATKFINGALIILFLNLGDARSWFEKTGLVNEIALIVIPACLIEPVLFIL